MSLSPELQRRREDLIEELKTMGEFRRGSINVQYRRCGKPRCVCTKKGHRGHGPQTTLTYKDRGTTRTRNLPSAAAVGLVRQQIERHDRFVQWSKRWRDLSEEISDRMLDETLSGGASERTDVQKKQRTTFSRRSKGRSRA